MSLNLTFNEVHCCGDTSSRWDCQVTAGCEPPEALSCRRAVRPLMKDTPGTLDGTALGCLGSALYTFPGLQQRKNLEVLVIRSIITVQVPTLAVAAAALPSIKGFLHCRARHCRAKDLPVCSYLGDTCICGLVLESGWLRWSWLGLPGHSLGHHSWRGSLCAHWHLARLLAG